MKFLNINKLKYIKSEIKTVRGGSYYTSVYLRNGDVFYLKEDFETINKLIVL
jgi:hypothetical protein